MNTGTLVLKNSLTNQRELNQAAWAIAHRLANGKKGSKKFFGQALKQCHAVTTRYATLFFETAKNYLAAVEIVGQNIRNKLNKQNSFNFSFTPVISMSSLHDNTHPTSPTDLTDIVKSIGGKPPNTYYESFSSKDGKVKECVEWDADPKAKNYIANIRHNPLIPEWGYIERRWIPLAEDPFYVKQELLIIGECYEFSSAFKSRKSRRYGIPVSHSENSSTFLFFETSEGMFSFKKELDSQLKQEVKNEQQKDIVSILLALIEKRASNLGLNEEDDYHPITKEELELLLLKIVSDPFYRKDPQEWLSKFKEAVLLQPKTPQPIVDGRNSFYRVLLPIEGIVYISTHSDIVPECISRIERLRPWSSAAKEAACKLVQLTGVVVYLDHD